ncbi:hypothetical protein [Novipirellula caenicola]
MTLMTLAQVQASNRGPLTRLAKRQIKLSIPVSQNFLCKRAAWSKKVRFALVTFGSILTVAGIAIPLSMGMRGDALWSTLSVVLAFSILALIVGICFPYLDDMNGSKYISGVRFLKDGRILIPGVHETVLGNLPELKRGFFDGFLGNESLKPKQAR